MQSLTITSDVHIGAQRSAGTTPLTAWQLRQYLIESFREIIEATKGDLCILGDLFDTGNIPMADVLATWEILRGWLGRGQALSLVRGNHDVFSNSAVLSSFQFLCKLLKTEFEEQVTVVDEPMMLPGRSVYVVPHVMNQSLADLAISQVPKCDIALFHLNYENKFATQSDHSLNLTIDQAMALPVKKIVIAHEHQHRTALGGKVLLPGNPFPSSISDCLGNVVKYKTVITGDKVELVETWGAVGNYVEADWRILGETNHKFIRVVGEASAAEAAEVVSAISKFRNKSKALVITNAVQIEGAADGEQIKVSLEEVKSFDVLGALLECLDEREQGVVKKLLGEAA